MSTRRILTSYANDIIDQWGQYDKRSVIESKTIGRDVRSAKPTKGNVFLLKGLTKSKEVHRCIYILNMMGELGIDPEPIKAVTLNRMNNETVANTIRRFGFEFSSSTYYNCLREFCTRLQVMVHFDIFPKSDAF